MVGSFGLHPTFPTTGKRANLDRCFCVHRYPQPVWAGIGGRSRSAYLLEDGVGFSDLFFGLAFATVVGW